MANTLTARLKLLDSDTQPFDIAVIDAIVGREAISQLYHFDVHLSVGADVAPQPSEIAGTSAVLVLSRLRGNVSTEARRIHGIISRVEEHLDRGTAEERHMTVRLVPRAHGATLVKSQDVFIDKSVRTLTEEILEPHLGTDVDFQVETTTRDFVVKYAETDMAFISRLTEHLGVSFVFTDGSGGERMLFTDPEAGFPGGSVELPIVGPKEGGGIKALTRSTDLMPEKFWVMDYDYMNPNLELTSMWPHPDGHEGLEFEYGSNFTTTAEGDALARARARECKAKHHRYVGESDVPELRAGFRFGVSDSRVDDAELLMVEVEHELRLQADSGLYYNNRFVAVAADSGYCPPRRTPKPVIAGVISGIVEPKAFGEIENVAHLDTESRYRVKFIFDTTPLGEQKASKAIRMVQASAGPSYGVHFPLRPGVEVMVAFLNGDPDRPIIVGAVHTKTTPDPLASQSAEEASARSHNIIRSHTGITMVFKDLG